VVGACPARERADFPSRTFEHCKGLAAIKVHGGANDHTHDWLCGGRVSRAIFLVRHPFRAALADHQRREVCALNKRARRPDGYGLDEHVSQVDVLNHSRKWGQYARDFARAWLRLHGPGPRVLKGNVASRNQRAWLLAGADRSALYVRYEDLVDRSRRHLEVLRIVAFVSGTFPLAPVPGLKSSTSRRLLSCSSPDLWLLSSRSPIPGSKPSGGSARSTRR